MLIGWKQLVRLSDTTLIKLKFTRHLVYLVVLITGNIGVNTTIENTNTIQMPGNAENTEISHLKKSQCYWCVSVKNEIDTYLRNDVIK